MIHPDMHGTVDSCFYDLVGPTSAGGVATAAARDVLEASVAVVEHIIDGMAPKPGAESLTDLARWE